MDCYENVLSKQPSQTDPEKAQAQKLTKLFAKAGGFDYLKTVESKYNCAGICKVPLFYMTKSVNLRPTSECGIHIIKEIGSFLLIIGYLAAASAFLYFIAFCGSFSACSPPTNAPEEDDDKVYKIKEENNQQLDGKRPQIP